MQLIIQGRNIEVNDQIWAYVERKIGKMDRYLADLQEIRVELSEVQSRKTSERYVVQATARSNGMILRAEERRGDLFAAVDAVADKLHRQISRYKGKRRRKIEKAQAAAVAAEEMEVVGLEAAEGEEEAFEGRIVRFKRFELLPMSQEEAVDQMELLGHDFFVFYNAGEAAFNVLYRRSDGDYGLIQPEIA
ncbi:MAG: ribosome-associated translation inhibitor RaiA [Chloroflexota bacterium]|nr:ribosome-associated translation inhibitor RaiA [Chloroflexota bacterium]